jgi:prevent-host-death family protein
MVRFYQGGENMTTITATKAREKLYQLVDLSAEAHEPIQITGKRNNAVLISEDDWRSIQETLHLISIPDMKESIIAGGKTPIKKCTKRLNW